jgi:hypothetical protein
MFDFIMSEGFKYFSFWSANDTEFYAGTVNSLVSACLLMINGVGTSDLNGLSSQLFSIIIDAEDPIQLLALSRIYAKLGEKTNLNVGQETQILEHLARVAGRIGNPRKVAAVIQAYALVTRAARANDARRFELVDQVLTALSTPSADHDRMWLAFPYGMLAREVGADQARLSQAIPSLAALYVQATSSNELKLLGAQFGR